MLIRFITLTLAFMASPLNGAQAATQSLALLETGGLTPLVCANGSCKAEFSTYCLQKNRDLPRAEAPYEVATGSTLTLVLTDADGNLRRISAAPNIRIKAARSGHTAVMIEMPQHTLAALGAQRVALDVGAGATLMPVPIVGDDNPQTEQDQRIATGPLRKLGAKIVDRNPKGVEAVLVLNRLVNALPMTNKVDSGARTRLWNQALDRGFKSATPQHIAMAKVEYNTCWRNRVVELGGLPVRDCLEKRHDRLMWKHVKRYWKAATGTGS
jgi:hypothetical protein